jgi:hypothetical protein
LVRIAVVALLGLTLLLAGCASKRVQTAADPQARSWEWCDHVQQNRPTVICFQQ